MDAWLLSLFGRSSSPSAKPVLTAANAVKRSVDHLVEDDEPTSTPVLRHRQPRQHRIAHWDKKREKCRNCSHIYLKTLSLHAGFCSVDCKSNSAYIAKVNRTIRAVKDAVERQQQDEQADTFAAAADDLDAQFSSEEDDDEDDCDDVQQPHTFAAFGLESRIHDAPTVQWAFSAVY